MDYSKIPSPSLVGKNGDCRTGSSSDLGSLCSCAFPRHYPSGMLQDTPHTAAGPCWLSTNFPIKPVGTYPNNIKLFLVYMASDNEVNVLFCRSFGRNPTERTLLIRATESPYMPTNILLIIIYQPLRLFTHSFPLAFTAFGSVSLKILPGIG